MNATYNTIMGGLICIKDPAGGKVIYYHSVWITAGYVLVYLVGIYIGYKIFKSKGVKE